MPTPATQVGPLPIPAPVGDVDAALVDETSSRLAAYVAHWLRYGLDSKLATMTRPPSPNGAVPLANVYTSPPSSVYLKQPLPALFVYWNGPSKSENYSTVQSKRVREFSVMYVFSRVVGVDGVNMWSGLVSTIDAIMFRAFDRLAHPTFTYDSAYAVDTDVRYMNRWLSAEYLGGAEGFLKQLVQDSTRQISTAAGRASAGKAQGGIQEGFPSYQGTVRIAELVGYDSVDETDLTPDILAHISAGEGPNEVVPNFLERVLEAPPDGSEALQQDQD